jgi:hypothetical protein
MTTKRAPLVFALLLLSGTIIYFIYSRITPLPLSHPTPYPYKIINHEKPKIQADFSPFTNVGCKSYRDFYDCEEGSQLLNLGCNTIENKPLLGGLTPAYPIAACNFEFQVRIGGAKKPDDCFYYFGGFKTFCRRYVIYKDGKYQIIKTMDDFRQLYSPVDSPSEALSFALATDNYFASYGQTKRSDYIYSAKELEDTFVESVTGGYLVHVFYTPTQGCGPFVTRAVEIKVTYEGLVEVVNYFPVYRDPSEDEICIE